MKKFMNYIGEGIRTERRSPNRLDLEECNASQRADSEIGAPAAAGFLHQIRRSQTREDFFRICREFLDHDEPMPLEPDSESLAT